MKELQQQSRVTGIFTNITQEDIEEAEDLAPDAITSIPSEETLGTDDPNEKSDGNNEEVDDPNERLGGANPDIEKEPVKDRMSFRDKFKEFLLKELF